MLESFVEPFKVKFFRVQSLRTNRQSRRNNSFCSNPICSCPAYSSFELVGNSWPFRNHTLRTAVDFRRHKSTEWAPCKRIYHFWPARKIVWPNRPTFGPKVGHVSAPFQTWRNTVRHSVDSDHRRSWHPTDGQVREPWEPHFRKPNTFPVRVYTSRPERRSIFESMQTCLLSSVLHRRPSSHLLWSPPLRASSVVFDHKSRFNYPDMRINQIDLFISYNNLPRIPQIQSSD